MSWHYLPHEELYRCFLLVWNEGEWEHPVSAKIFGANPKKPLNAHSLEECQTNFFKLEQELANRYALKRLAARNLPSFVLEQELTEHLVSNQTSSRLVSHYQSQGYIDNEGWLKGFIAQQKHKLLAPQRILMLLRQKGAPEELIVQAEELLKEESGTEQCLAALQKLLKTRFRQMKWEDPVATRKLMGALARKGFGFEVIQETLKTQF